MRRFSSLQIPILLMALAFSSALAGPNAATTPSITTPSQEAKSQSALTESDLLRAQLASMEQHQNQLLSTVHWALGVIATVGVALLGFGWFANFRVYERDRNSLREELTKSVDTSTKNAELDLRKVFTDTIEERFAAWKSESEMVTKLNSERDSRRFSSIEKDITRLRMDIAENEARHWLNKEVYVNAVNTYQEVLCMAIDIGDEFATARVMDAIMKALDKIISGDEIKPDASDIASLTAQLQRVRSDHRIVVEGIMSKLQRMT